MMKGICGYGFVMVMIRGRRDFGGDCGGGMAGCAGVLVNVCSRGSSRLESSWVWIIWWLSVIVVRHEWLLFWNGLSRAHSLVRNSIE
ncbi:hypothetical protein M0R45_009081 [Rubus argutus]|uniref:Transmembrane protein n=1 Tax=Rubus argutus TaxID=59490 RepID=A0AAW1Y3G9_RUBAR